MLDREATMKRYDKQLTISARLKGTLIGWGRWSIGWGVFDERPFLRVGPIVIEYVRNANR
jgi:hypothetical protein